MTLKGRNELPLLFNDFGLKVGVEIGVLEGEFSRHILSHWPGNLIMVDPWEFQDDSVYHDVANISQEQHDKNYRKALQVAHDYNGRCDVFRTYSIDAAAILKDRGAKVDWVYFDGNHSYESVVADLVAWYPLVNVGGILSGHDFLDGDSHNCDFGVASAVTRFIEFLNEKASLNLDLHIIEETWPSWYFVKEKDVDTSTFIEEVAKKYG